MRPMFPSLRRSSKGSPRFRYSEAIFTTNERLDSTSSFSAPTFSLLLRQAASFCSSSRVNSGNSPMSDKYLETELLRSCGLYSMPQDLVQVARPAGDGVGNG